MLIKIAFYIFQNNLSTKEQMLYICRLVDKLYNDKHGVYIHTSSSQEAENFDTQLWTFKDISFVPHAIYTSDSAIEHPILIGHQQPPKHKRDVLINLTPEILPFYQDFQYLVEIVPQQKEAKILARKRFKIYQTAGYKLETFNV